MRNAILAIGLALLGAAAASAQSTPWYIVVHPPYPGRVLGGPFDSFQACAKSIGAYQGSDFQHQYMCEIHY